MPAVEVVVPYRDGCPHRAQALRLVLDRYDREHPDWKVTVAELPTGAAWCKARAVNPAVTATGPDIVVVADADVWTSGLGDAVDRVACHLAPWAIPHHLVHRLDRSGTGLDEPPYRGVAGGGIVVLPRSTARAVPLDPRFVGWGQEDVSWAVALHVLAGPAWRGTADLIHLWHPPQPRDTRKIGCRAGQVLHRRYLAARKDPERMRQLIAEAEAA